MLKTKNEIIELIKEYLKLEKANFKQLKQDYKKHFENVSDIEDLEENYLYMLFDNIYSWLGYNLELDFDLLQLNINGTSDLIEFYFNS